MLQLDHIIMAADRLAHGVARAEAALGVRIPAGGAHPLMGTHNHVLRLGETLYFEVIAPDPDATQLSRPRWFALDDPRTRAELAIAPRLATWVVATDDIEAALQRVPHAVGPAVSVTRGSLAWLISVPPDGSLPFAGAFPAFIQWPAGPHPASRMPDVGCRLISLEVAHPDADVIARSLAPFFADERVRFSTAPKPSMRARIRTPLGERELL